MLQIKDIKNILLTYNFNTYYGPTIYKNNNDLGLALDLKDSTFGYLTRFFTFENINDLDNFLTKYIAYKNNKLDIKLSFDDYLTTTPTLIYTYQNKELSLEDLLNLKDNIKTIKSNNITNTTKQIYLINIEYLTKYLINLIKTNISNKETKNNLKIKENDLKYQLLQVLAIYYDKDKNIAKKGVTLDTFINDTSLINELENNLKNLPNESIEYLENYLKDLINKVKTTEYDDKNIINAYSNLVYNYNIDILTKQIAFVNSKITSEKNFNLKGSKIHNIDAELKSFLKTNTSPPKYEVYLQNIHNNLDNKYQNIPLENAYNIISGENITIPTIPNYTEEISNLTYLNNYFNNLDSNTKNALILYNSLYKKLINYIIDNNYPSLDIIKNNFDMSYYYDQLDDIIHQEKNISYYEYFTLLDFKNIDSYLNSLINIAHTIENTNLLINTKLFAFTLNNSNKYKELSLNPLHDQETYLIEIKPQTNIIYINTSLEIDLNTEEISLINTNNIYYKGNIKISNNYITVNNYEKINHLDKKNDIIITKELNLINTTNYRLGEINHE